MESGCLLVEMESVYKDQVSCPCEQTDNLPYFLSYYHILQLETMKYLFLKGVLISPPQVISIKTIKWY